MKRVFALSLVGVLIIAACKKKNEDEVECVANSVDIHLQPRYQDNNYEINQVIDSPFGYKYFFTSIKVVGTNLKNNGAQIKDAFLFDFAGTGSKMMTGTLSEDVALNLNFNVGVPSDLNTSDPSAISSASVLNISNIGDMHWGWNPGYKFVLIEGKADTIADGVDNFDHSFFFHLGTDFLFRTKSIADVPFEIISDTKRKATIYLNVDEILDSPTNPTDLRVNYASHSDNTQMFYSVPVMDEFIKAIKK